ncbi:hypothetical protein, partial [Cohnella xylanilytica]|uniref:hypothetical protein n=1 Tax=Cohnella xylanilytica TaxID=557555 RepID=UPI001BB386E0
GGVIPMWILVSKFRWSHSHLFTVVDPLLDDRHRILMRFRNSGLISLQEGALLEWCMKNHTKSFALFFSARLGSPARSICAEPIHSKISTLS